MSFTIRTGVFILFAYLISMGQTLYPPTVLTVGQRDVTTTSITLVGSIEKNGGSHLTSYGFYWGTDPMGFDNYKVVGTSTISGEFTHRVTGLTPGTRYYVQAFAKNGVGTALGTIVTIGTAATSPSVTSKTPSSTTATSIKMEGSVDKNGGSALSEYGFYWGTSSSSVSTKVIVGTSTISGSFSRTLSGLSPGTPYYYKAYAKNGIGTSYGSVISCGTSASAPTVSTKAQSSSSTTSITMEGSVDRNGGSSLREYGFYWGTSSSSVTTKVIVGTSTIDGRFSRTLPGLNPGTTYYYKAYAINGVGPDEGAVVKGGTAASAPVVTTKAQSSSTTTSITMVGSIDKNGGSVLTEYGFYWGTSSTSLTTKVIVGTSTIDGNYSRTLPGLNPGTTYYYKAYAVNGVGPGEGAVVKGGTAASAPVVTTKAQSSSTSTSITMVGSIDKNGGSALTEYGFYWGTSSTSLTTKVIVGTSTVDGNYSRILPGLNPGTTYYYKAYAINGVGPGEGAVVKGGTAASAPVVTTKAQSSSTTTSITMEGSVDRNGGSALTEYGFYWGTSATSLTTKIVVGTSTVDGSFSKTLPSLTPGTPYYYKAYAINGVGPSEGAVVKGGTAASVPVVTTKVPSGVTTTSITMEGSVDKNGGSPLIEYGFYWGTSSTSLTTKVVVGTSTVEGSFSKTLPGLNPGTPYYYKAYAINGVGPSEGAVVKGGTAASVPVVISELQRGATATSITMVGSVEKNGGSPLLSYGFEWGTSSQALTEQEIVGNSTITGEFTKELPGLTPGSVYYYRAFATNGIGTARGTVITATTAEQTITKPTVLTKLQGPATASTIVLNASVESNGGADLISYGFLWGISPTVLSNKTIVGTSTITGPFSKTVDGLTAGTPYYYQAFAENEAGFGYGTIEKAGTAAGRPSVLTVAPTNVTCNSIIMKGKIDKNGGSEIKEYGFYWGMSSSDINNKIIAGNTHFDGEFSSELKGLLSDRLYYFKAYATNGMGTAEGVVQSVKTPASQATFRYGDVNGDGLVNSIDYALMKRYLLKIITEFPSVNGLSAADVDGSNSVNSIDYAWMRRYLLGITDHFPMEREPSLELIGISGSTAQIRATFPTDGCVDNNLVLTEKNNGTIVSSGHKVSDTYSFDDLQSGLLYEAEMQWSSHGKNVMFALPVTDNLFHLTDLVAIHGGSVEWDPANRLAIAKVNNTTRKYNLTTIHADNTGEIDIINDKIVMTESLFRNEFYSVLSGENFLYILAGSHLQVSGDTSIVTINGIEKRYLSKDSKIVNGQIVVKTADFAYDFNLGLLQGEVYLRKLVEKTPGTQIGWDNEKRCAWVSYNGRTKYYKSGDYGVRFVNDRVMVSDSELTYLITEHTPTLEILQGGITRTTINVKVVYPYDGNSGNELRIRPVGGQSWSSFRSDRSMDHGIYTFSNLVPGCEVEVESRYVDGSGYTRSLVERVRLKYNDPYLSAKPSGINGIDIALQYPFSFDPANELFLVDNGVRSKIEAASKDGYYKVTERLTGGNSYSLEMVWMRDGVRETKTVQVIAGEKIRMYSTVDGSFVDVYQNQLPLGAEWIDENANLTLYSAEDGQAKNFPAWKIQNALARDWLHAQDNVTVYTLAGGYRVRADMLRSELQKTNTFTKYSKVVLKNGLSYKSVSADGLPDSIRNGWAFINRETEYDRIGENVKSSIVELAQGYMQVININRRSNLYNLSQYGCDGYWVTGGETYIAVKKFQQEKNLPATGVLDRKTFAVLQYEGEQAKNQLNGSGLLQTTPIEYISSAMKTIEEKKPVVASEVNEVNNRFGLPVPTAGPAPVHTPLPTPNPEMEELAEALRGKGHVTTASLIEEHIKNAPKREMYFTNAPTGPDVSGLDPHLVAEVIKTAKRDIIDWLNWELICSTQPTRTIDLPSSLKANIPVMYYYSVMYDNEKDIIDKRNDQTLQNFLKFSINFAYNWADNSDKTAFLNTIPYYGTVAYGIVTAGIAYVATECTPGLELEPLPFFNATTNLARAQFQKDLFDLERPHLNFVILDPDTRKTWLERLNRIREEILKVEAQYKGNTIAELYCWHGLKFVAEVSTANTFMDGYSNREVNEFRTSLEPKFQSMKDSLVKAVTDKSGNLLCDLFWPQK